MSHYFFPFFLHFFVLFDVEKCRKMPKKCRKMPKKKMPKKISKNSEKFRKINFQIYLEYTDQTLVSTEFPSTKSIGLCFVLALLLDESGKYLVFFFLEKKNSKFSVISGKFSSYNIIFFAQKFTYL